jgi:hypothetical protein
VRGLLQTNPVSAIDKPRQPPTKRPQPLAPLTVETIRSAREAVRCSPRTGERMMAGPVQSHKKPATAGFLPSWAILGSNQ